MQVIFFLRIRVPPRSTRTDTRIPYTTLFRSPQIGVVTSIGTDHLKAFHSIAAIAEEKGKLIACLPEDGTAVLNADHPRELGRASCRERVCQYVWIAVSVVSLTKKTQLVTDYVRYV